jgi:hypothetical protein
MSGELRTTAWRQPSLFELGGNTGGDPSIIWSTPAFVPSQSVTGDYMNEAQTSITDDLKRSLREFRTPLETRELHNDLSLMVLQCGSRSVGVDEAGGIWMRVRQGGNWFHLAPQSNSDVLELAAGFLITEED